MSTPKGGQYRAGPGGEVGRGEVTVRVTCQTAPPQLGAAAGKGRIPACSLLHIAVAGLAAAQWPFFRISTHKFKIFFSLLLSKKQSNRVQNIPNYPMVPFLPPKK